VCLRIYQLQQEAVRVSTCVGHRIVCQLSARTRTVVPKAVAQDPTSSIPISRNAAVVPSAIIRFSELPYDVQSFVSRLYAVMSNVEFLAANAVVNFFYRRVLSPVVSDFDWPNTIANSAFHFDDMPRALSIVQPLGNEVHRHRKRKFSLSVCYLWPPVSIDESVTGQLRKVRERSKIAWNNSGCIRNDGGLEDSAQRSVAGDIFVRKQC